MRVSLEEHVWTRLSRLYDEGLRAKDETDMHVCLQETEKRKETAFLQTQCVGTGGLTQLAKAIVAPKEEQFLSSTICIHG